MNFEILQNIIENRRTTKTALMNGTRIDDSLVYNLLQLANWAPTHAHTEPWRFVVFANTQVQKFCKDHADLYKANVPANKFETAKYEKIFHNGDLCSHLIAVYMKRGTNPKISVVEEICAVSAAVQNILLGATALQIAALWSTGGIIFHEAMKKYFDLQEEDQIIGFLYLGYSDKPQKEGERIVPLEEKMIWRG